MNSKEDTPRSRLRRIMRASATAIILALLAFTGIAFGVASGAYLVYSRDLPELPDFKHYQPQRASVFYADDGTIIGTFYRERRIPVMAEDLPPRVINAFLAAEDNRFYQHFGIDVIGIARAFFYDLKRGSYAQGGSTITQQVARRLVLSRDRTLQRKVCEAILACKLEYRLAKKELLEIYLNELYLGKQCYGVEAAALSYFGKHAAELSIAEAAMLAGMVSNPAAYNPGVLLERALFKRQLVLQQMLRRGYINRDHYEKALLEKPTLKDSFPPLVVRMPYFTETVRQYIIGKYGEEALYNQGLKVWTTCDPMLQEKAAEAVVKGAQAWGRRRGQPAGLLRRLGSSEAEAFLAGSEDKKYQSGQIVTGLVMKSLDHKSLRSGYAREDLRMYLIALPGGREAHATAKGDALYRRRDLVRMRVVRVEGEMIHLEALSLPAVESALVSIENSTGYVRALIGGLDYNRSTFNRATQARRQPGSAFKPIVFSAALEEKRYGPNTVINDEPIVVFIPSTDPPLWFPSNSDGSYLGPISLRDALVHSRNVVAVKVILDVGVDRVTSLARRLGIASPWGHHLSLALGACEVTLLELTSAYSVFPNLGIQAKPVFVKRVVDRYGQVLEDNAVSEVRSFSPKEQSPHSSFPPQAQAAAGTGYQCLNGDMGPEPCQPTRFAPLIFHSCMTGAFGSAMIPGTHGRRRQVMSPETAYVMLSMLRETCIRGTASPVRRTGRKDLAGKTGTTDNCTDAWFIGCNPRYTTGVWVGHDKMEPLGSGEFGAKAALPIWQDFMKSVPEDEENEISPPPRVVFPHWAKGRRDRSRGLLECAPHFDEQRHTIAKSPLDDARKVIQAHLSTDEIKKLNKGMITTDGITTIGRIFTDRGGLVLSDYVVAQGEEIEIHGWRNETGRLSTDNR
jgi:penicillin-binding protein 1A